MRNLLALLCLILAGCATEPLSQLETVTPTIPASQLAALQKNSVSPDAVSNPNRLHAERDVTVPLVPIPVDKTNRFRVPVVHATVNGHDDVPVLLDSGSNRPFVGASLAQSLKLPLLTGLKPANGTGIGGAIENYPAITPELRIGLLRLENLVTAIGPDSQSLAITRSFWGQRQTMITGLNSFRQLSYLTIDPQRGIATFGVEKPYRPDAKAKFATSVPLRWSGDLPVVDIMLEGLRKFSCVLDTGGDYGVILPRSVATLLGYWKPGGGKTSTSRGVGGAALVAGFEVRSAVLGGATLLKVPGQTTLTGPEPADAQVLLGNVVLRHYRVTFDFRQNMLWLEQ